MERADSLETLLRQIWIRKGPFFVAFFVIVLITYLFLYIIDFYPEPKTDTEETAATTAMTDEVAIEPIEPATTESFVVVDPADPITQPEEAPTTAAIDVAALPLSITIDKLDRTVTVLNPESRAVADLDAALLNGVVRHPDSADFANQGNIFILGHSSYLPNVLNRNFQAFNGIQDLDWGDTIRLTSSDTEYIYRVDRVYEAKASEVVVPVDGTKPKLTLATCDSFGSREDRYILEATLVDTNIL